MDKANSFDNIAKMTIAKIADSIELQDSEQKVDIDIYDNERINIYTESGQFVINKHSAAQEIWLSSPISGPYHFSFNENNRWLDTKNNDLYSILEQELSNFIPQFKLTN